MPTNVAGSTARVNDTQQMNYIRKTVNWNEAGVATGIPIGYLPAFAHIETASIDVSVAFNAATTNVLTVGTNATTYDNIVTGAQAVAGTQGVKRSLAPTVRVDQITADTMVYATYTQSGTAATAGQATITISYSVNNDL